MGGARRHAGGARERARAVVRAARRHHDVLPRHLRARLPPHRRAVLLATVSYQSTIRALCLIGELLNGTII